MIKDTYTCRVTPTSRKSCTRRTVAKTSFVCWSKTSIFHTGGPVGGGVLKPEPVPVALEGGSTGLFKLSRANSAAVCACCSVDGAVVACVIIQ